MRRVGQHAVRHASNMVGHPLAAQQGHAGHRSGCRPAGRRRGPGRRAAGQVEHHLGLEELGAGRQLALEVEVGRERVTTAPTASSRGAAHYMTSAMSADAVRSLTRGTPATGSPYRHRMPSHSSAAAPTTCDRSASRLRSRQETVHDRRNALLPGERHGGQRRHSRVLGSEISAEVSGVVDITPG